MRGKITCSKEITFSFKSNIGTNQYAKVGLTDNFYNSVEPLKFGYKGALVIEHKSQTIEGSGKFVFKSKTNFVEFENLSFYIKPGTYSPKQIMQYKDGILKVHKLKRDLLELKIDYKISDLLENYLSADLKEQEDPLMELDQKISRVFDNLSSETLTDNYTNAIDDIQLAGYSYLE